MSRVTGRRRARAIPERPHLVSPEGAPTLSSVAESSVSRGAAALWPEPTNSTEATRANSRAALIDAAFEEFTTKGYEATTVAGIAARAGVTTGALYAHFSGKLDVLLATVGLQPVDEIVHSVEEIASLPWSEASRRLIQGLSARPDRRRLLLLDVIVFARRNPHVAAILRSGLDTYLREMRQANDAGVALGLLDPPMGSDDLARVLALLILGKVVYEALGGTPPSEQAFVRLADVLLHAADPSDESERPAALARVRARAATLARARRGLDDAVVEALEQGHSLRDVGKAAGLSHERIRQVARTAVKGSDDPRRPADGVRPANSTAPRERLVSAPYLDTGPPPRPARGDSGEPAGDIAVQRRRASVRPARDGDRLAHRARRPRASSSSTGPPAS